MADRLTRPRTVLVELFNRLITRAEDMYGEVVKDNTKEMIKILTVWDNDSRTVLNAAFTGLEPARNYPGPPDTDYLTGGSTFSIDAKRIKDDIKYRIQILSSIRDMLPLYEDPSEVILAGKEHPASETSTTVFIIHGHSEGPKQAVARFLETATDATAIILHEQAKRGQAIIETLEEYAATAAFAIVLLTADDVGMLVGSASTQPRARQNVVFELGLFVGALGRSRVAVLYENGVELPSDMNGILYTQLDSQGAWQIGLGRELRAAGFAVDLNKAK